jgi:acyl carrier protein
MSESLVAIKEFLSGRSTRPLEPGELERSRDLLEDEVLDSLGIWILLDHLGERFGIEFAPEELVADNFKTLDAIAELVDTKIAARS